jgi:hypothetical protein
MPLTNIINYTLRGTNTKNGYMTLNTNLFSQEETKSFSSSHCIHTTGVEFCMGPGLAAQIRFRSGPSSNASNLKS